MAQLKSTIVSGSLSANGGSIDITGTSSVPTPYLDFRYNNSTDDYTSRIIESSSGTLNVEGSLTVNDTPVSLYGHAHPWNTTLNLTYDSKCVTDSCGYSIKYNKYIRMVYIRTYIVIKPTADISAGTAITLATITDSNYHPSLIYPLSTYRAANMRVHAMINASGQIRVRCSSKLTAGTSYGFYVTGYFYKVA